MPKTHLSTPAWDKSYNSKCYAQNIQPIEIRTWNESYSDSDTAWRHKQNIFGNYIPPPSFYLNNYNNNKTRRIHRPIFSNIFLPLSLSEDSKLLKCVRSHFFALTRSNHTTKYNMKTIHRFTMKNELHWERKKTWKKCEKIINYSKKKKLTQKIGKKIQYNKKKTVIRKFKAWSHS